MNVAAAIVDSPLRQAWTRSARRPGRRARRSDPRCTIGDWRRSFWRLSPSEAQRDRHRRRRRSQSPGLCAPVSPGDCAISRRTVVNNAGSNSLARQLPRQGDYFAAGVAVFLLAEFFLRSAKARRFRCVRRSRFFSERRASSSSGFLWSANFAANFFFSLVSSDSLAVFFAIRSRASLYT